MSRWIIRHYYAASALVVATALLVLLVLELLGVPLIVQAPLAVLILIAWLARYVTVSKRLGEAAAHAFEEECDPEPLLTLSRDLLVNRAKGRAARRADSLTCRLNIATALTCLGRDGEALAELDALSALLSPEPGRFHLLYALNRAVVCARLGRIQETGDLLDRAEVLLETVKLSQEQDDAIRQTLRNGRAAYRYLTEGPLPELEEIYRALLSEAPTQRMKVGVHLTLGKFALDCGDEAEARAHLAYAAEHGNKLYYRAEAERLLAGLTPAR